jgi:serine/threonine protein kinase
LNKIPLLDATRISTPMTAMENLIGQTLGQYKIIEQIGEGGMATVFRAYQPGLNREVAVKVLPPYVAKKPGFTDRFMREAQAIGNLNHPNILPVHDSGQDKEYSYIVMRYVPNARTLAHLMAEKLAPEKIVQLISQIAAALDHAHQAGIIHRDIKPSNILMDGDWVLLSDFGLAKMVEMSSELTGTGVGVGTPSYMSPEQAKGEKLDHRTDIYSLGIILFEMLTGQIPHKAETPLATVIKRINEPLPRPRSLNPDMPEAVEQILLKALATNPADRFSSAGEMASALRLAFAGEPTRFATARTEADSLVAPRPHSRQQANAWDRLAEPAQMAAPVSPSPQPVEFVIMGLLGLVSLCAFSGIFLSFTTNSETGQSNAALAPACIGLAIAGITSAGMLWLRNRRQSASAWLALGLVAWFVGLNILGWGGFAALTPNENNFVENLGFSLALCFIPGGILALLGLGLYGYDYRRGRQMTSAMGGAAASNQPIQQRAEKLKRATEYCSHITRLIKQKKGTPFAGQLAPLATKLNQWEARLRQLVHRLDTFETNTIIQQDLREVPATITRLRAQLAGETDPRLRAEIQETLARHQQHQQQLNSLVTLMRRTELDIDETLAAIGAIYSQLQLLGAKDIDSQRASRLSADVEEQNQHLNDLLAAMEEVYEDPAAHNA